MKFAVKRTSDIGEKLQSFFDQRKVCFEAQKVMCEKYNFSQWIESGGFSLAGGISSVKFSETPDRKVWRYIRERDTWYPKLNSKEGKIIDNDFSKLPLIDSDYLNNIFSIPEFFNQVSLNSSHKEYFGLDIDEKYLKYLPEGLEEITTARYNELFKK